MVNNLQPVQFEPYEQNINIVKNYFKKSTTLALALINFVSAVLLVLMCFLMSSVPSLQQTLSYSDALSSVTGTSISPGGNMLLSSLITCIPSVILLTLTGISFLLIYIKSRNSDISVKPTAGFNFLKTLIIIQLVITIVMFLSSIGFLFLYFYTYINANDISFTSSGSQFTPFILISVFSIIIIAFIISILYSIFYLRFINGVKTSMSSPVLSSKGAGPLAGFSVIYLIITSLSGLSVLVILVLSLINEPSVSTLYIGLFFVVAMVILNYIFLIKLASGWKKEVQYIKTAHLRDYNDGYDIHSILNINNIPQPVFEDTLPEVSIPGWEIEDSSTDKPSDSQVQQTDENHVTCPSCNAQLLPTDKFCTQCGHKMI